MTKLKGRIPTTEERSQEASEHLESTRSCGMQNLRDVSYPESAPPTEARLLEGDKP